jgi:hypothetical protein
MSKNYTFLIGRGSGKSILREYIEFENQLANIRVVTNISKEECKELAQKFIELGKSLMNATILAEEY